MRRERLVALRLALAAGLAWAGAAGPAHAFRVFDVGTGLGARNPYYLRWDAASRLVEDEDRSLAGGLRYSMEGGSYEAFRDQFSWDTLPTVEAFQAAVDGAFAAWEAVDPVSGLGTSLDFVPDLGTLAVDEPPDPGNVGSSLGLNAGAEIDLFAETPHLGPAYGGSAIVFVELDSFHDITLSSGASGYAGLAISGADIRINPIYTHTLDEFQILLTHEIGHAIGLADVEVFPGDSGFNSPFLDDDYDGSSSASALATLTNSFALEIDPYDPDATPLLRVMGELFSDPGLLTPGVDILMESSFNYALAFAATALQNDDFAGRQFLYPMPEPALAALLAAPAAALAARSRAAGRGAAGRRSRGARAGWGRARPRWRDAGSSTWRASAPASGRRPPAAGAPARRRWPT
jgi:hypothetical protein